MMDLKAGVVGAGLMGAEIALVFALDGYEVILNDRDAAALDRGTARIAAALRKGVERGRNTAEQAEAALARIHATTALADFADCGIVTEAVFEAIEVKTAVLQALDAACAAECVIATNTSTIPISTLAGALSPARRIRMIGTHYFSPVSRMPLVEVIPGFDTDSAVVDGVSDLMRGIGKTPIVVKDVAGFAVNRMLHAMMIEAVRLVEEGVASPEDLDTACRLGLGHPIGPFALMDVVRLRPVPSGRDDLAGGLWRALPAAGTAQAARRRWSRRRARQARLVERDRLKRPRRHAIRRLAMSCSAAPSLSPDR